MVKKDVSILETNVYIETNAVLGDILVVQPSFLFPTSSATHTSTNITSSTSSNLTSQSYTSAEEMKAGGEYLLGVGICFSVAAACAMGNVINVGVMKANERITTVHLMLMSGVFAVLLSLLTSLLLPNRLLTAPLSLSLTSTLSLLLSAGMTFMAFWFISLAVTITKTPTLISMLRSTEIVLSLGTESIWWGQPPHYLSIIGSLLVMLSVVLMTKVDLLTDLWKRMLSRKGQSSTEKKVKEATQSVKI